MNKRGFVKMVDIAMISSMLFSVGLQVSPALALAPKVNLSNVKNLSLQAKEKAAKCLNSLQATISASPQPVKLLEPATLSWNVTVPSSSAFCTGINVKLYVDGLAVSPAGSRSIQPIANYQSFLIAAVDGGTQRTLATADIKVDLPERPEIISINANYMVPLLLQALSEGNKHIRIENHVELDLSGREFIPIAAGVILEGGRTAREPGPRLFTTIRPNVLFEIVGDNVRIKGLRIEGPNHFGVVPEDEEPNKGVGIRNVHYVNVEITNNEIYGWSQAAVRVDDCDGKEGCPAGGRMLPSENPTAVHIHDNYIHHNQRAGREGYGISLNYGAYALIERNVFDWNRHAIKGGGELVANDPLSGAGYAAYSNLVLKNGGYHDTYNACDIPTWVALFSPAAAAAKALCVVGIAPSYTHYTHQFDMHGTETCGLGHLDCGDGGHSMYIRHNTFLYTAGNAIKLRGIPEVGMFIGANVFAHGKWEDAVVATEHIGAYAEPGNVLGVDASMELGSCDFDGDGLDDAFMATGATWWFSSGGDRPWVYLNTSTKRRAEVTLGFFNADNICDVWVDGVVYPGGKPQKLSVNRTPLGGVSTSTPLSR
ncbi:MAG: right-handed parallel beta-helix repeat-containing protein [Candidatus Binatia bacterium]